MPSRGRHEPTGPCAWTSSRVRIRDDPEVAHDLGGQHSLVLLTGDQGGAGGVAVLEELAQVAPIVAVSDVPARL